MAVEASWLPDPGGAHELRYWDGAAWTEHVSDAGVVSVDAPVTGWPEPAAKKGFRDIKEQWAADMSKLKEKQKGFGEIKEQWAADRARIKERHQGRLDALKEKRDAAKALVGSRTQPVVADGQQPLLTVSSHDDGRNATVSVFADRVERVKDRAFGSLSKAKQDTEVIPIRAISSVQAKKAGMRTAVTLFATGNEIVMRIGHAEAQAFKDLVMKLVLAGPAPQPAPMAQAPAAAPAAPDRMAQLKELASLRDSGVLTEDEFAAEKARVLGT